jgi:hypothetical protein
MDRALQGQWTSRKRGAAIPSLGSTGRWPVAFGGSPNARAGEWFAITAEKWLVLGGHIL